MNENEVAERDDKGRFLKSGNPAGRPVGSKNKATAVKEQIEELLTNELREDALEVFHVALRKAKEGDNAMIKFTLGEMLAAVRNGSASSDDGLAKGVRITINNMTREEQQEVSGVTIEQEDEQ